MEKIIRLSVILINFVVYLFIKYIVYICKFLRKVYGNILKLEFKFRFLVKLNNK